MSSEKLQHRNYPAIIYTCFGGFSNTGITAGLAGMAVVDELGLSEVCIGCLAALSQKIDSVITKTNLAEQVITVDGCPKECAKKEVEKLGIKIKSSIVLTRDIKMKKQPFDLVFKGHSSRMQDYLDSHEVEQAKEYIISEMVMVIREKKLKTES